MRENKKIAKRYAEAFLHEKMKEKEIDTLVEELASLIKAFESDDKSKEFFRSPVNSREMKLTVLKRMGEKLGFSAYTILLLETLIKKDRMNIISDIFEELRNVSDRIHGRVRIDVTTANEPSRADIEVLSRKIGVYFERKALVTRHIDTSIIGGFVLEGEGKLIDMSVKGQIERALTGI